MNIRAELIKSLGTQAGKGFDGLNLAASCWEDILCNSPEQHRHRAVSIHVVTADKQGLENGLDVEPEAPVFEVV